MTEAGVDGFVGLYWNGVLAPAGTPQDIIGKLNAAINAGLNKSEIKQNLITLGMRPKPGSPQDFATLIADRLAEMARYRARR